ncbi:MAG: tetratricopeptide repeat protein [Planctomycetes bacterium]|nr:tetratricopeptide repeat protein [Planctomycetota bacterium]
MTTTITVDVLGILSKDAPEASEIVNARASAGADADQRRKAVHLLATLAADAKGAVAQRRGLVLFVLGRDAEAAAALVGATTKANRTIRARALSASGRPSEARQILADHAKSDATVAAIVAECSAELGDADALEAALAAMGKDADAAERSYLEGRLAELNGERVDAVAAYEKAMRADPPHARALFRRAFIEGTHGDEDNALQMYKRCVELSGAPRNAWMNLGNIYEDRGEFTKARECFRTILDADPSDGRARLFDKDAAASHGMFYDEDLERRSDKRAAILRLPVTDFELSVRSRNCLAKMGVRTLGDLVQKTEAELLSYKNFGETSLQEIKDVLAQKGVRLGMSRDEIVRESEEARTILEGIASDGDKRKLLAKPLQELELSVRSRHCMNVLGLKLVGDLCAKSETELMTIKNFGQTSLNEVKQKLAEAGLSLAPNPVK